MTRRRDGRHLRPRPPRLPAVVPPGFTPFELPEVVAGETFLTSLTRSLWGRVAVLAVSGLLGLAGVLAVWMVMSNRQHAPDPKPNDQIADPASGQSRAGRSPMPSRRCRRRSSIAVGCPSRPCCSSTSGCRAWRSQPPAMKSLAFLGPWWQPSSQTLLHDLNLGPEQVRRLTWASTDPARLRCELRGRPRIGRRHRRGPALARGREHRSRGEPRGPPAAARRSWPHPLLAVDAHTIVTGSEEALRQLVARGGDAELASGPMELLLKKLSPGGDLAVMVDLSPRRDGGLEGAGRRCSMSGRPASDAWHLLCETPLALGLSVQSADQRRCELGLVCDGETKAEGIRLEVEKLVPAAIQALPAHIAALKDIPSPKPARRRTSTSARMHCAASINTSGSWTTCSRPCARPVAIPPTASSGVQFDWAGRDSWSRPPRPSIVRRCRPIGWPPPGRLTRASTAACSSGLLQLRQGPESAAISQGAASGAVMLRPETRVSWIAELLPYLGHRDWHRRAGQRLEQRP